MTKREAVAEFNEAYPPGSFSRTDSNGRVHVDKPMRNEAWNNFTDALCKDGRITMHQYETWTHPWKD